MAGYKTICSEIVKAVSETAAFITAESERFDIKLTETKGLNDFVSYVDKGSERMLVTSLGRILPEAGFLTEEGTASVAGKKFRWIVDPLDGTTNFLHGIHPYAISVALSEDDEIVAGVVYEAAGNEVFTAWKDGGAYLNGKPIKVSSASRLADTLVATGFPYSDFGRLEKYIKSFAHFCQVTHGIRRLGSASIDLAYVACGRFDAFYEYGLHPWDIAAGILLVREAGGAASDFSGNMNNLSGDEVVAANGLVFNEFLEIVTKFMHE